MRRVFGFLTGIMIGSLFGALLALLLAPQKGEALRAEISSRATGFVDEIKGAADARRAELERQLAALRAPRIPVKSE